MTEKEWDEDIPDMPTERYDKLNDEMKSVGDKKILQIKSEKPKKVPKSIIEKAREKSDKEFLFPARESYTLNLKEKDEMWEFWFSITAYSILRNLKAVKKANNGTLMDAWVSIERIAVGDKTQANWKIGLAKPEKS